MNVNPDMIGMVVEDMKATLDFYRTLGLDIPEELNMQDHAEITTENGYRLAWDTVELAKSIHPDWTSPVGQRITLAFKVDSPASVDEVCKQLQSANYNIQKEPWDAFWGQRYAVAVDPDGNNIDIFAPLTE